MTAVLSGLNILEVEGIGPGPFAGMLLADLGADVIVVHRRGTTATPGVPERPLWDRGKRSIVLDLKDPDDVAVFKQLVARTNALIEGFRPGVMERLGLGPEVCHAVNPALVYGRITGWGQDGPMRDRAGHDLNFTALSGAAWYASPPGATPYPPPTITGDVGGGSLYLVVGLLAGVMQARETGVGTVVDAAITDGLTHMMNLLMTLRQSGGLATERGTSFIDGAHWSRCYRTSDDGYISVQCLEPKFYIIFLQRLGLSEDADFSDQFNQALWPELTARLKAIFAAKPRQHWESVFANSDACVTPVLSPAEARNHPLNAQRNAWIEHDGVLQGAAAPRFSTGPVWTPRASPDCGANQAEILGKLNEGNSRNA